MTFHLKFIDGSKGDRNNSKLKKNIFQLVSFLIYFCLWPTSEQTNVMSLSSSLCSTFSVTRLGDFWKFLGTNLLTKVAIKDCRLFGLFWKWSHSVKTAVVPILVTFGKICDIFLSNIWSHCSLLPLGEISILTYVRNLLQKLGLISLFFTFKGFLPNPIFVFKSPTPTIMGHQCSWTLIPANSMQVFSMQSDDCNRK